MKEIRDLENKLSRISGRGYKAYKDIEGRYQLPDGTIMDIHHTQGDPFASPSKIRVFIPIEKTGFPQELYSNPVRKMAFQDYLLRYFKKEIGKFAKLRGTGKSGLYFVDAGKQKVLLRSDCRIEGETIEIRFTAGLPARGRSILGNIAIDMLCREIPHAVSRIKWEFFSQADTIGFVHTVEDAEYIRCQLKDMGIVAFIKNGSILPRRSGVDDRPLNNAIPFKNPETLKVTVDTLHHGTLTGMGIPEGVTLIVGGGFHGKSTLLAAIQDAIYPHIPGDGREFAITVPKAVKIRSEDGRYIAGVDISPFINNLPLGADTSFFSTEKCLRIHLRSRSGNRSHGDGSRTIPHRRGHHSHQLSN